MAPTHGTVGRYRPLYPALHLARNAFKTSRHTAHHHWQQPCWIHSTTYKDQRSQQHQLSHSPLKTDTYCQSQQLWFLFLYAFHPSTRAWFTPLTHLCVSIVAESAESINHLLPWVAHIQQRHRQRHSTTHCSTPQHSTRKSSRHDCHNSYM